MRYAFHETRVSYLSARTANLLNGLYAVCATLYITILDFINRVSSCDRNINLISILVTVDGVTSP